MSHMYATVNMTTCEGSVSTLLRFAPNRHMYLRGLTQGDRSLQWSDTEMTDSILCSAMLPVCIYRVTIACPVLVSLHRLELTGAVDAICSTLCRLGALRFGSTRFKHHIGRRGVQRSCGWYMLVGVGSGGVFLVDPPPFEKAVSLVGGEKGEAPFHLPRRDQYTRNFPVIRCRIEPYLRLLTTALVDYPFCQSPVVPIFVFRQIVAARKLSELHGKRPGMRQFFLRRPEEAVHHSQIHVTIVDRPGELILERVSARGVCPDDEDTEILRAHS